MLEALKVRRDEKVMVLADQDPREVVAEELCDGWKVDAVPSPFLDDDGELCGFVPSNTPYLFFYR